MKARQGIPLRRRWGSALAERDRERSKDRENGEWRGVKEGRNELRRRRKKEGRTGPGTLTGWDTGNDRPFGALIPWTIGGVTCACSSLSRSSLFSSLLFLLLSSAIRRQGATGRPCLRGGHGERMTSFCATGSSTRADIDVPFVFFLILSKGGTVVVHAGRETVWKHLGSEDIKSNKETK